MRSYNRNRKVSRPDGSEIVRRLFENFRGQSNIFAEFIGRTWTASELYWGHANARNVAEWNGRATRRYRRLARFTPHRC
jgi:hypothetical protein